MEVLIGVDPHKGSVAVAAIAEALGELVERASFPQDRAGLRALERWARRFPERRWAVENAGGLGQHLAVRLAGSGESVVDVPPKLSARVRVLSSGNARKVLLLPIWADRTLIVAGSVFGEQVTVGSSARNLRCSLSCDR